MKMIGSVSLLSLGLLAACGTAGNINDTTDSVNAAAEFSHEELLKDAESLSLSNGLPDACEIKMSQLTYTKAAGAPVQFGFVFLQLSGGDRIRIIDAATGEKVWGSSELQHSSGSNTYGNGTVVTQTVSRNVMGNLSATGNVTIPISALKVGEYFVRGYKNTYASDQEKDCGAGRKIVIRSR
ncbi:MAG: hypothetical protein EBR09_15120 [Proteobacteria bacterium]|nr:hypothetical protein [Pseudomonadota bacterium]